MRPIPRPNLVHAAHSLLGRQEAQPSPSKSNQSVRSTRNKCPYHLLYSFCLGDVSWNSRRVTIATTTPQPAKKAPCQRISTPSVWSPYCHGILDGPTQETKTPQARLLLACHGFYGLPARLRNQAFCLRGHVELWYT